MIVKAKLHLASVYIDGRIYTAFINFADGKPILTRELLTNLAGYIDSRTSLGSQD